jgi:hypothetical protein
MGVRGPIPIKKEMLRGHHAKDDNKVTTLKTPAKAPDLVWSKADPKWIPAVKRLYQSLQDSAMAITYQPSDVCLAFVACDILNTGLTLINPRTGSPNGVLLQTAMAALVRLGTTEGDRRRLGIEIEKQQPDKDVRIAIMDEYRKLQVQ